GFIVHQPDGRIVIETLDGAFDYFDDLSHSTTPFPSVYLQLDGRELKRIDEQFWPRYAIEIRDARAKLNNNDALQAFRAGDKTRHDYEETKSNILTIVLAYLYGGRSQTAWAELHKYWPPYDEKRIRWLI